MSTKKLRTVDKLDLNKLTPDQLEYFCISDDIDREVMKRKGKTYNEDLAFNRLYFVVTKDKRVAVLPVFREDPDRFDFEDWMKKHNIDPDAFKTIKDNAAQEARDWFIEVVHGFKTAK